VHDPQYVRAVRLGEPHELAESQGFPWDEGIHQAGLASAGAAADAARAALEDGTAGALSTGLHHATHAHGAGFCTYNGLALAALAALDAGAHSVLILDLDAHCGGGTHSIIETTPTIHQIDVSISAFDGYAPSPGSTLDIVTDAADYLPTIRDRLNQASTWCIGGLVLFNAGMDPWERSLGGLRGITQRVLQEREDLVFAWARQIDARIAFVPAGGYKRPGDDPDRIVELHRLTIESAERHSRSHQAPQDAAA
jgi:acetoin utilization deacetylase AcuC-like enzyme